MGRKRATPVVVPDTSKWDLVPLPPDTYEKPTQWSREPVQKQCRRNGCPNMTTRDPAICDTDFYALVRRIQSVVIAKFPPPSKANGV